MKKLKKFFGVFGVVLLLMSMDSNDVVKKETCRELASIHANNLCCYYAGENYTTAQYNAVYQEIVKSCP
ncbi:hypothetical protein [Lacinutrix algicola]|uniref:hypothetical protein n=1 Tax=Lacinutrix algicola TaxID=342954 RepID=UPI0006E330CF|nr:hypothetical protein [Lacinutrix algicola]